VHDSSLVNLKRALVERVFRIVDAEGNLVKPPEPETGAFQPCAEWVRRWSSHIKPAAVSSVQQIVNSYSGPKKKSYGLAALSLLKRPLTKHDARLQAFVKSEKLNFSAKKDPAPRLIQPRSQRYNLELGRYLKLNEKKFLKGIDAVFGYTVVLSGYDSFTTGRIIAGNWRKLQDPVILSFDFKRLDQHTRVPALEFEHSHYTAVWPEDENLKMLLSWQLRNEGIALAKDGAIYFTTDGNRCSGDINTSLGNKLIVCGLLWTYLSELGILDLIRLGNNGDDCFLMIERGYEDLVVNTIHDWFLKRGFRLELEPIVDVLEELVFCQSNPVCVDGRWRMVRTMTSIAKDSHTLLSIQGQKDLEMWFAAVGQCGLALNQGVPVLQSFHGAFLRNSNQRKVSTEYMHKVVEYGNIERMGRLTVKETRIAASTRLSFHRAFGIEPSRQIMLEQYYDELTVEYARPGGVKSTPTPYSRLHPNNFC